MTLAVLHTAGRSDGATAPAPEGEVTNALLLRLAGEAGYQATIGLYL